MRVEWNKENIRSLREHLGLSQREFAERIGTKQQRIDEWERGRARPNGIAKTLLTFIAQRARFVSFGE